MNIKNILITGANGQLGREMRMLLNNAPEFNPTYTDVEELDITDREAINTFFDSNKVDCVVNCAAYTAVDRAEHDVELCHKLNVEAVENLALAAKAHRAKMIHISTDYVFDGTGHRPYTEHDATCPTSVYGKTKLEGEQRVLATLPNAVIIRTSWLYSPHGKNFVKTMIELGCTRSQLRVVCDQVGTPTYAIDLAQAIMAIMSAEKWIPGIYHFSNEGAISWYDFAIAIHHLAGIHTCQVTPCTTDEYHTDARRPYYSVLDKRLIKATYGIEIPHWIESLGHCISRFPQDNE